LELILQALKPQTPISPPWRPALGIEKQQERPNQQRHWEKLDLCTTSQIDLNYG
jgi:hypothetical protein